MEELRGDRERGGDGAQPRVDFRGKGACSRAHLRKRSVCLHSGLCTSPKSLPLHLCPRWPLDVPASIKDEPSKALKDFPLCLFLPPSFLNQWVSCLRDSRSTNADDVKGAMGQKSERVQV